jgi:hypothetical protein
MSTAVARVPSLVGNLIAYGKQVVATVEQRAAAPSFGAAPLLSASGLNNCQRR